jgi:hypothetical protein
MKQKEHSKNSLSRACFGNEGTLTAAFTEVANEVCEMLSSSSSTFKLFWRSRTGFAVASVLLLVYSEPC